MRRPRRPAQELRFAIECLPHHTRVAMLDGIQESPIIVGAYTDRDGGVCPMLAAHRRGGRTSLVSFARAWDRYTRAGRRSRRASHREVHTLKAMLEGSMLRDDAARGELAKAVAELKEIKARRAAEENGAVASREPAEPARRDESPRSSEPVDRPDIGEHDRMDELSGHHGWAWLRVFRRYDDYQTALDRVKRAEREVERREVERV
jgi:hypothetical protein